MSMSNTGSPDPTTSYSSSTPFTSTLCMRSSFVGVFGPRPTCVSKPVTAVTRTATVGVGMPEAAVRRARDAASRGEWQEAFDLLAEADADGLAGAADLPVLGEVAYAAGHLDVAIEAWERTHARCVQAGDRVAAAGAAVRVAMHLLFDTALMAPVRGWLARAERLLEDRAETPVHAWLTVVRAYERMLTGDLPGARQCARRAIEMGATCDPAASAIARI